MASSVLEDQDYVNKIKQQAASIYDPQRDLALNKIDQSNAALDINQTDIGRQYDTLGQNLRDQASKSSQALEERRNQLGLLQSGGTAAGLGDIQKNLNTNLANAEQDKASRLAQLALQRAGLTTQRAQVQIQYTQGLNDYVTKLLDAEQNRRDTEEKNNQALQLAQQKAAISASKSSSKSSTYTNTIKTSSGKNFKVTPAITNNVSKILQAVPSDNKDATGNNDNYFSQNELNQGVQRVMATYGVDQNTAEQLVQQSIDANGYVVLQDWNSYSPEEQQAILNGTY